MFWRKDCVNCIWLCVIQYLLSRFRTVCLRQSHNQCSQSSCYCKPGPSDTWDPYICCDCHILFHDCSSPGIFEYRCRLISTISMVSASVPHIAMIGSQFMYQGTSHHKESRFPPKNMIHVTNIQNSYLNQKPSQSSQSCSIIAIHTLLCTWLYLLKAQWTDITNSTDGIP